MELAESLQGSVFPVRAVHQGKYNVQGMGNGFLVLPHKCEFSAAGIQQDPAVRKQWPDVPGPGLPGLNG